MEVSYKNMVQYHQQDSDIDTVKIEKSSIITGIPLIALS